MSRTKRRVVDRRHPAFLPTRTALFEVLESRDMPAGGLNSAILGGGIVEISATAGKIDFAGNTASDAQALATFWNAPNGQAGTATFGGTLTIAGKPIIGSFSLAENSATGGVAVVAASTTVQLGSSAGLLLSGADGAFEIYNSGAAGIVTSGNSPNSVSVVGVKGLAIAATAPGLSYQINQTGQAVSASVATANGPVAISFANGSFVQNVVGAADFTVSSATGTVARVGGIFTDTELSNGGIDLSAQQVTVDFSTGTSRSISVGSAVADFTISSSGFALTPNSFTVGGFTLQPTSQPTAANAGNYAATAVSHSAKLGPLNLQSVSPVLAGLSFGPLGLSVNVGLTAATASLTFQKDGASAGAGDNPVGATATTLTGTLQIAGSVNPATGLIQSFSAPGAFSISAATFDLSIPKVLDASATNLSIGYDPSISGPQQIISAGSLSVSVPALKLTGTFAASATLPALVISTNGFAFGSGTVTYNGTVSLGSILSVVNPSVTLGNFSFSTTTGVSVGSFAIGASELDLTLKSGFKATGTNVSAAVGFDPAGAVNSFNFQADSLTAQLSSLLTVTATGVVFNPTATGTDPVLSLATASANVNVGPLSLTGTAANLAIGADGSFTGPTTLSIAVSSKGSDDSTKSALGLPSFVPFKLENLELDWDNFAADPSDFLIHISAGIDGKLGPVTLSGSVDDLVIDPGLLAAGSFPIVGLAGFSATASGQLFGGSIGGAVFAGIIKTDALGNILPDDATSYANSVFYGGIEGHFAFGSIGADIKIGFDQNGFLAGYLSASVPILLDPDTGLALGGFSGGISFNATPLPVPTDPTQLNDPIFQPTTSLTTEQWQDQLEQQVVNQLGGGSHIFPIVLGVDGIEQELNSGTITPGGVTDSAFTTNGHAVSDSDPSHPTVVTTLTANSLWEITYQGAVYFVQAFPLSGGGTNLEVSEASFTLPNSDLAELGTGSNTPVTSDLISQFLAQNIVLGSAATITQIADGSEAGTLPEWKITDGTNIYYVSGWGTGASQVLAVTGGGASYGALSNTIRIEAGATLIDEYASADVFQAGINIIFTTDGKFVIDGNLKLASSISADIKVFGDLSSIVTNTNDPLKLVFLAQFPAPTPQIPSLASIGGILTVEFLDANGNSVNPVNSPFSSFDLDLQGEASIGTSKGIALVFGGDSGAGGNLADINLLVSTDPNDTKVVLNASGSLSLEGAIDAADLVTGAGTLIFDKPANGPLEIYGAAEILITANSPGLSFLQKAGIQTAAADLQITLNTTNTTKDLTLQLPGLPPEDLQLAPQSLNLQGTGTLLISDEKMHVGADLSFTGAFAAGISIDQYGGVDLSIFLAGQLDVTLSALGQDLKVLTLDAVGLIDVRDIGGVQNGQVMVPQFGAVLDLFIQAGVPGVISATGSVELLLNTTGQVFTYTIPDGLQATVQAVYADSLGEDPSTVTVPTLPALQNVDGTNKLQISIPAAPPPFLNGVQVPAGPYFFLQFGDPTIPITSSASVPGPNGLTNVNLSILSEFNLTGNFRISVSGAGFELDADAVATLALPGVGNILNAEAKGVLEIAPDGGLYGALGLVTALAIPGNSINFSASTEFFVSINTTSQTQGLTFSDPAFPAIAIPPKSGEVDIKGALNVGALEVDGQFQLLVGAQELDLKVAGSITFNGSSVLSVAGTAQIIYGLPAAQDGLVLHAAVSVGGNGTIGAPGIFQIGGSLSLDLDTRPSSYLVHIGIANATLNVLSVINFTGSADITFAKDPVTQQPYFVVSGSLSGNLFHIINASASGFLDSRGYFDLNLAATFQVGTDSFGIKAGASLFIERTPTIPLDFGGTAYGEVDAFGVTLLGASISISYDGYDYAAGDQGTGKITAEADFKVLFVSASVKFGLGYLVLTPSAAPALGTMSGNTLQLNVGAAASNRAVSPTSTDEDYIITSAGPGTNTGEKIVVQAFGSTQTFDNVTSVNGDFGTGNDELLVDSSVGSYYPGLTLNIKGEGTSQFVNDSQASVVFDATGSSGNNLLLSQGPNSTLLGGSGNDTLSGSAGGDTIKAGPGNDTIEWKAGSGTSNVYGGTGTDTLVVYGSDSAENYTLTGSAGQVVVGVTGALTGSLNVFNVPSITINGGGAADTASFAASDLAAAGVTNLTLNLSRISVANTANNVSTVTDRNDGSVDSVTITGTSGADTYNISASGANVVVVTGGLTITDQQPGTIDKLTINSGNGVDTFNVADPAAGYVLANQLLQLSLNGQGGNDVFNLPVGGAVIDGGTGTTTANFLVGPADAAALTLTSNRISTSTGSTLLTNVTNVGISATIAAALVIQSTPVGSTLVNFNAPGSSIDVKASTTPVNIKSQGGSTVLLESIGAAVSVVGTASGGDGVTLGAGLLSSINGAVVLTNVDNLIYDDSKDGTARTVGLTGSSLTVSGLTLNLTETGVKTIEFKAGLGNDTINAAAGPVALIADGNGGIDTLAVTLNGLPSAITPINAALPLVKAGAGIETTTFVNLSNNTATSWSVDNSVVRSGSAIVLDGSATIGAFTATFGNGANSLLVQRVLIPTALNLGTAVNTVTIGGTTTSFTSTLDNISALLTLTGTGTANSLILNDTNATPGTARSRTIGNGVVTGPNAAGSLVYSGGGFNTLTLNLGAANNSVNVSNLPPTTTVNGSTGNDSVTASQSLGNFTFNGNNGIDTLTLQPGTGTVTYNGGLGGADTLVEDDSSAVSPVAGGVSYVGNAAQFALTGLPTIALALPSDVEIISVLLGSGNDSYLINVPTQASGKTFTPQSFTLNGGAGNDSFSVQGINGNAGAYNVTGGAGTDTLTLAVTSAPTANQFAAILPNVETLIVDGSANPTAVAWKVNGSVVTGNGLNVIDSSGAGQVTIKGGTSNNDTLTLSGSDATRPINAVVNGALVTISQGSVVLSQTKAVLAVAPNSGTVQGLTGAKWVVSAPSGTLVFASGTSIAAGIAVFRRDATTGAFGYLRTYTLETGNASALAISPDGKTLYAANDSATTPLLDTFSINALTGTLTELASINAVASRAIAQLTVSPDGKTVVALPSSTGNAGVVYTRNTSTGLLTQSDAFTLSGAIGRGVFSNDSTEYVLPLLGGSVAIYQRNANNTFSLLNTVSTSGGVGISSGNQVQVSTDGTLLFSYSAASQTISYYKLSPDVNYAPISLLGTLTNVGIGIGQSAANKVFKYDDSIGVLTALAAHGTAIQTYKYNASTSSFTAVVTYPLAGAAVFPTSLDENTNNLGTHEALVTLVSQGNYEIIAVQLTAAGGYSYANIAVLPSGVNETLGPVGVTTTSDNQGPIRLLAAYAVNGISTYTLVDPSSNASVASYNIGAGTQVLDAAVYKDQYGLRGEWLAIENTPGGRVLSLYEDTTVVPNNAPAYEQIQKDGSRALTGSLAAMSHVKFSPDGTTVYLTDDQGNMAYAPYNIFSNPSGLSLTTLSVVTTGFSLTDLAAGNGKLYGVSAGNASLALFSTSGSPTVIPNGYNSYNINGASAAALSANNQVLYVATQSGNLVTLKLNAGSVVALRTLTFANPSGGVGGAADLIYNTAGAGNQILIASPGSNAVEQISLNATTGVPVSVVKTITDNATLNLAAPQDLTAVNGAILVAASGDNAISGLFYDGTTLNSTTIPSVVQGQVYNRTVSGLQASAVSPDGRYLYGVSPSDNAVAIYDTTGNVSKAYFNGYEIASGLAGVSLVGSAKLNGVDYGYVLSPSTGTVSVFSGTAFLGQTVLSGLSAATSIAVAPDGSALYVTLGATNAGNGYGGNNVLRFTINSTGLVGGLTNQSTTPNAAYVQYINGIVYVFDSSLGRLSSYNVILSPLGSANGLTGVTGIAQTGNDVYAVSSSSQGIIYHLSSSSSMLTLLDTLTNAQGAQGLDGASAVAISTDGKYVFVSSKTGNSVAVLSRNATTGVLTFAQLVRDGRGVSGIAKPTGLFVNGTTLTVSSGGGTAGVRGGFALLDITQAAIPAPNRYVTTFQTMKSLEVDGGSSADTISVAQSPGTLPLTIKGNGGGDLVSLFDLGASGTVTTVSLGAGTNEVDVNQTVARTTAGNVSVISGTGADTVNIAKINAGTTATINLSAVASTVDVVNVNGNGLATTSAVTVTGRLATTSGGVVSGPALIYNGQGATLNSSTGTGGTITFAGHGTVTFTNLYTSGGTQQVFLLTPPRPTVTIAPLVNGQAIAEGNGVTLTATDAAGLSGDTYAWDLNGDGNFTDATGSAVSLTWAQLQALGITTFGTYPIAVRVTNSQNTAAFAGKNFSASADAAAILTIADTAPTITAPSGTATLGVARTLTLAATDPGSEAVTSWTVDWGDGTVLSYGAGATSASHTYLTIGSETVKITAFQGTNAFNTSGAIVVSPGAGTVGLSGPITLVAGASLPVTAVAAGSPVSYSWALTGPGVSANFSTATPTLTQPFSALGVTSGGAFTLAVTANYSSGSATASTTLNVTAIAPTATLSTNVGTIAQGSATGSVVLSVLNIADPAPGSASPSYTVSYDFNNDGTIDLANVPATQTVNIPAQYLAVPGNATVRAVIAAPNGLTGTAFASFTVTAVAPTLTVTTPQAINEGGTASFQATVVGPGASVSTWQVQWGDGSVSNVAGNGTLTQTFSHVYANNPVGGSQIPISVTAATNSGLVFGAVNATVNDVAPVVALTSPSLTVAEGTANAFTLNVGVIDPGADTVVGYTVNWGDGTSNTYAANITSPTHTYASTAYPAAAFAVNVTSITNNDGTFANPSNTLNVQVSDAAPVLYPNFIKIPANGVEGSGLNLSATAVSVATGTKPLTFTWTVTSPAGAVTVLPVTANSTIFADPATLPGYQYATTNANSFNTTIPGTYLVSLVVNDGEGGQTTASQSVTVVNAPPKITTFNVPATGNPGQAVSLSAAATDPGGASDPLTYTWTVTEQNTGNVQTLNGPSVSFTPNGGQYAVQLVVSDSFGGSAAQAQSISVVNPGPTIPAGGLSVATTGQEGGQATFSVTANDPGGTTGLTYRWTVVDPNGGVTILTGPSVQYTYPIPGAYSVGVVVTDPVNLSVSASSGVTITNLPPHITTATVPTTGVEGVAVNLSATAGDPGGTFDPLSYVWTITGNGATATVNGPNPSFTPADNGSYTVSLAVNDSFGGSDSRTVGTIIVANAPPVLGAINLPTGPFVEGQSVGFSTAAPTDVAADLPTLVESWTITGPNGLNLSFPNQGTSLPFTFPDNGQYTVIVTATDKDGGVSAPQTAIVNVANLPPVLQTATIPAVGYAGNPLTFTAKATDVPGDLAKLTYTWTITPPSGPAVTLNGPTVYYTPTASGNFGVSLSVSDTDGGLAGAAGNVSVAASSVTLPSVTIPSTSLAGSAVNLQAAAVDSLNGAITYTWMVTGPNGQPVSLTGSGANVSFVPTLQGSYSVSLLAKSPFGQATATGSIAVSYVAPALQQFNLPANATITVPVTISALGADPVSTIDAVGYAWTITNPTGATAATGSGTQIVFTPTQTGLYGVKLVMTDGGGSTTVNRLLPVLRTPPVASAGGPYVVNEGSSITLDALTGTTDPSQAPSTLTYAWDFTGNGLYTDATGAKPTFSAARLDGPSTLTVRVKVTDSVGVSSYASALVTVKNVAPTLLTAVPSSSTINEGSSINLSGTFSDPGIADTHVVTVNWGDGSAPTTLNLAAGVSTFSTPSHQFLDNPSGTPTGGTYGVKVFVTDKDQGVSATINDPIVVNNVAPTASISGNATATFGQTNAFTISATDPSPTDTAAGFNYTVNWGDGTSSSYAASVNPIAISHTYANAGTFVVNVVATDKDRGNSTPATKSVVIGKATPTFTINATNSTYDGTPYHSAASEAYGVANVDLGRAVLVYYAASDTNLTTPLAAAPTSAGSYRVVGTFAGTSNYNAARSAAASFTILQRATTTVLVSASPTSAAGQAVTFTATVSTGLAGLAVPTGDLVQFKVNGANYGSPVAIDGNGNATASITFAAGTNNVTATYLGDANLITSTSGTVGQVNLAPGAYAIGTVLYVVGANTNDLATILPFGFNISGSGGLTVLATLNNSIVIKNFIQTFTSITFFGLNGNDNITVAPTLTLPTTVVEGNGNNFVNLAGGNDNVTLGTGSNHVFGGNGDKTITANDAAGTFSSILLGNGNNNVTVGNGNDNIQLGNGSNVVIEGNGNDYVSAGNGSNLVVGGLGQHTIVLGNGNNILIDGSATLASSTDSFRQVLNDWNNSPSASVNTRIKVTYNKSYPNRLLSGCGRNWFFYQSPATSNKKSTDRWN